MGGRRRRMSTSTVATVDDDSSIWSKELDVLKPCQPGIEDDEWPIFILNDVVIYEKDGKTMGNPLFVNKVGPMVVRGRLVIEDDEEQAISALVNPRTRSALIEITGSVKYSIGDNPTTLWVSGAAGWFEVRTAPEYMPVYLEIRQAIVLFYEVQDAYIPYQKALKKMGKKKSNKMPNPPPLDQIFFRAALRAGEGDTLDEMEALFVKWTGFFISHLPTDTSVSWEGTPFAQWVKEQDDKKPKPRPKTATPQPLARPSSTAANNKGEQAQASKRQSVQDVEMTDLTSPLHDLVIRNGKHKAVETPVPVPPHYKLGLQSGNSRPKPPPSALSQATPQRELSRASSLPSESPSASESPVDRLMVILEEIAASRDIERKGLKAKTVQTQLYMKCSVGGYQAAPEVLSYFAKDLLTRLGREWRATEFYGWLKQCSARPLKLEHITEDQIPLKLRRRAKAAARASKGADAAPTASDDGSQAGRPRKSGKGAGLRPPQKRPADEMDIDDDSAGGRRRPGKYVKYYQPLYIGDEEEEEAEAETASSAASILEEVGDSNAGSSVPLPKGAVPLVFRVEKLPSMMPTGPEGTWRCQEEGCGHVIRAADEQAGRERVLQHFRDHEHQAEQVDLALKESRAAGHTPINHLLEKLQKKKETQPQMLDGKVLPTPIRRRLL